MKIGFPCISPKNSLSPFRSVIQYDCKFDLTSSILQILNPKTMY